jgi:ABC-type multidrug transport system permease subunit
MFLGLVIAAAGTAIVANYQKISDYMLSGVSSYDRCKFWGIIIMVVGLLIMANIHTLLLTLFVDIVFKR